MWMYIFIYIYIYIYIYMCVFACIYSTTRAEDARGTPTQSQMSPSILFYEDTILGSPLSALPDSDFCSSQPRIKCPLENMKKTIGRSAFIS